MKGSTTFISPVVFSGSIDHLRNAVGGYWEVAPLSIAHPNGLRQEGLSVAPLYGEDWHGRSVKRSCIDYIHIAKQVDDDGGTLEKINSIDTSGGKIVPNSRVYVRLSGDPRFIKNDKHWETLIKGGRFGQDNYVPILSGTYLEKRSFPYYIPYNQYDYNIMKSAGGSEIDFLAGVPETPIQIKSVYNVHLPKYEKYVQDLDSELLIPNIYWLRTFNLFPPGEYQVGDTFAPLRKSTSDLDPLWRAVEDGAATTTSHLFGATYEGDEGTLERNVNYVYAEYTSSITNFLTRDGKIRTDLATDHFAQPKRAAAHGAYSAINYQTYLTSSLALYPLKESTTEEIMSLHKNIMFDNEAVKGEFSVLDELKNTLHDAYQDPLTVNEDFEYAINYTTLYPYYISIKIPNGIRAGRTYGDPAVQEIWSSVLSGEVADTGELSEEERLSLAHAYIDGDYKDWSYGVPETPYGAGEYKNMVNLGFVPKLLKTLKDIFVSGSTSLSPINRQYVAYSEYKKEYTWSSDDEARGSAFSFAPGAPHTVYNAVSAQTASLRTVPLMDLYVHAHNHYSEEEPVDDSCFVGPNNFSRMAATDRTGDYRYANTTDAIALINSLRTRMGLSSGTAREGSEVVFKAETMDVVAHLLELFDPSAEGLKRNPFSVYETIAYRIEKIGGEPTGDSQTENVLQNIWIAEPSTSTTGPGFQPDLEYVDSQVKYGQNYTYKVYAYVIVTGLKYKYDNVAISRQIANPKTTTGYVGTHPSRWEGTEPIQLGIAEATGDGAGGTADSLYCLEYFDAKTGNQVTPLPIPAIMADIQTTDGDTAFVKDGVNYAWVHNQVFKDGDYLTNVTWEPGGYSDGDALYTGFHSWIYPPGYWASTDGMGVWASIEGGNPFQNRAAASTDGIQLSNHQYRAEFTIQAEASFDIIEVPLYTKTLKVLDNPPNRLQVEPLPVDNNSQTIAFALKYSADHTDTYPATLTPTDSDIKRDYMHAQDFIENQPIPAWTPGSTEYESRSLPAEIEVFRLSTKPSTIQDFWNSLRTTIDLSLAPETKLDATKTVCDYFDTVSSNHKYYYVFRAKNRQGMPGDLSPIYEVQLVDDGGYKFSIFNTLSEEELEYTPITISKNLKKVFEVIPNLNHTMINLEGVDFSQPAHTQLPHIVESMSAPVLEDTIWGDTYKLRLTSKKTGRKIDLNIKYNLNSE